MYNLLFNIKILFLLIPDATVTGLSAMIYILPEYHRVWAVAPALVQTEGHRAGQCHTLTQDLQPPSAQLPVGGLSIWGYRGMRSWRTLLPWRQSWQGSSVVGEESIEGAEEPRAHGRHSPSTLTVGKDTEQYSLEEKCQDVQCAVFCCYTGVFPSIMRLPSEHMALSFLFLLLAHLDAKQPSKTKKVSVFLLWKAVTRCSQF